MKKISFAPLILAAMIAASPSGLSSQPLDRIDDIPQNTLERESPANNEPAQAKPQSPVQFREVWGYLMRDCEKSFKGDEQVTDVCYFCCGVSKSGRVNVNVNPPSLPDLNGKRRRIHIVIADLKNTKLMRRVLDSSTGARGLLVGDIVELSKKFDGVQIDFEAVASRDASNFVGFLGEIKSGLEPGKVLSVALPPKTRKVNDAYDYAAISAVADRIYIMAYDQHWSKSRPGPVASLSWCKGIMAYAKTEIPAEKLIMGIPLYGRAWKETKITKRVRVKGKQAKGAKSGKPGRTVVVTKRIKKSKSVKTEHIDDLISRKNASKEYSPETGYRIRFGGKSKVTVYCDDINAIMEKFLFYREFTDSIGFWRLGMESRDMWKEIEIRTN